MIGVLLLLVDSANDYTDRQVQKTGDPLVRNFVLAFVFALFVSIPVHADEHEQPDAATLLAHGIPASGYKQSRDYDQVEKRRRRIFRSLNMQMDCSLVKDAVIRDHDLLDAAVCTLAAYDFVRGLARSPECLETARKEGWIWVATKAK